MVDLIEPIFNFTGSKYKLLPQLLPLFSTTKPRFVDLFCGGGAVWSNVLPNYEHILINDVIGDLIQIQYNLIFDHQATMEKIAALKISKEDAEGYGALRADYNLNPTPEKLFMLMLCCTNNMMRFNQSFKFNQTFGRRTFNDNTADKIKRWYRHISNNIWPEADQIDDLFSRPNSRPNIRAKISFSKKRFQDVEVDDRAFVYADPPYITTEAGYNAFWDEGDDSRLFDYLVNLNQVGGHFCLSGVEYHDGRECSLLNRMNESGFKRVEIVSDYEKVSRKKYNKNTKEVVYLNY